MTNQRIKKVLTATAMALTFAWTASAGAADFFVFGNWHSKRGLSQMPVMTGGNTRAAASAQVTQPGGANKTIVFQTDAFTRTAPITFWYGLAYIAPSLVQLATEFAMQGPQAVNRSVKTGPKTSRNANFSACPAQAILTGCTAPMPSLPLDGRLTYTASTDQLGGVMQMLITGLGTLTLNTGEKATNTAYNCVAIGTNPTSCPKVLHSDIAGSGNPQLVGATLGNGGPITLFPGPFAQVTSTKVCLTGMKGCIGGSVLAGVTGGGGIIANWGAPFTAGNIVGSVALGRIGGPSTISGMGSDNRTAGGSGNLTLVAGGISNRLNATSSYVMFDTVNMRLAPTTAVTGSPSMGPAGLATFTALLALAGGYSLRRRSRREN
ncbi:MAG: hypothetical protein VCC02_01645 [Myxococcota bacterium]